jgi:hypothetical protein
MFVEIGNNRGAEMIWSSCTACLAHLTALCELAVGTEPTASLAMNTLCNSNLEKLGHLTWIYSLGSVLANFLGYCRTVMLTRGRMISLTVYESRISSLPMGGVVAHRAHVGYCT